MHVSLVLLVGQLLVLAQGAFAIATGVNLLRGAQTLGDVSAGFAPLDLSRGEVTGTAIAGIVVGALLMIAGLRVRGLSLRGRLSIAVVEVGLLLISAIAIGAGGENLSVISVAVLAFAGSPILPGAAVLGVQATVIYALVLHPGTELLRRRRQAARLGPPLRVYLPAQPRQSGSGAPPPRYAGPPARAQPAAQIPAPAAHPAQPQLAAQSQLSAQLPPAAAPPAPGPPQSESAAPKLQVMPPVSPRLVIPARDVGDIPAAALDLRIAGARPAPLPGLDAPPPAAPTPTPAAPVSPGPPAASAGRPPAARPSPRETATREASVPGAPVSESTARHAAVPAAPAPVERSHRHRIPAQSEPATAARPTSTSPSSAPATSARSLSVGLKPSAGKNASKRTANQQLLRPARGAGAELRDMRLKPGVRPRVLPPPDDDEVADDE